MRTLITVFLTLLTTHSIAQDTTEPNQFEADVEAYVTENDIGRHTLTPKRPATLVRKINSIIDQTSYRIDSIENTKEGTKINITWQVNGKEVSHKLVREFPHYYGEDPEITKRKFGVSNFALPPLYFYSAPLGKDYGTTYDLTKDVEPYGIYRTILKNLKVYLHLQYRDWEYFIPILATSTKEGCEGNIFTETPEILCIQFANAKEGLPTIGSSIGFSNSPVAPYQIENKDEINSNLSAYYANSIIR